MRGGSTTIKKVQKNTKGVHCRGDIIYGGDENRSTGALVGVGTSEIVMYIG